MIEFLMEWLVAGMSAWALTEVIRHGSLFERPRAWLEARGGLMHEWIGCGFCFSHWAAGLTTLAAVALFEEQIELNTALRCFLVWLCATRLSNVLNDVFYSTSRLDKGPSIDLPDVGNEQSQ